MKYVLRRLGFFVVTLWACLTINFVLPRLMPGNPAIAMMARFRGRVNGSVLHALEIAFGVNTRQSEISQYFSYLRNTFTGHLGISLTFFPETVVQVVRSAILWTLGLVGLTTVLAFVLGTLIGMISGWRRGSKIDSLLPPIFVITSAFPYFFVALLSLLLFSITWHWLPSSFGYANTDTIGWTW
jgi:peptide/nickel transport system permease protein